MSLKAVKWAVKVDCRSTKAFAVLMVLAEAHNEQSGECWPYQSRIRKATKLGETAVKQAIRELEADGIITRATETCPNTGRTWRVCYHLALESAPRQDPTPEGAPDDPSGGHEATPPGGTSHPLPRAPDAPRISGTTIGNSYQEQISKTYREEERECAGAKTADPDSQPAQARPAGRTREAGASRSRSLSVRQRESKCELTEEMKKGARQKGFTDDQIESEWAELVKWAKELPRPIRDWPDRFDRWLGSPKAPVPAALAPDRHAMRARFEPQIDRKFRGTGKLKAAREFEAMLDQLYEPDSAGGKLKEGIDPSITLKIDFFAFLRQQRQELHEQGQRVREAEMRKNEQERREREEAQRPKTEDDFRAGWFTREPQPCPDWPSIHKVAEDVKAALIPVMGEPKAYKALGLWGDFRRAARAEGRKSHNWFSEFLDHAMEKLAEMAAEA